MQLEPQEPTGETKNDRETGAETPPPAEPDRGPTEGKQGEEVDAAKAEPMEHHPEEEIIKENIIGVLRTIYDPEIPVNIYDIGLIYTIEVDTESIAHIRMTLTSPMCPVAGTLPGEVEQKIANAPGVRDAKLELVWDPPWGPEKMSEAARLQLNI